MQASVCCVWVFLFCFFLRKAIASKMQESQHPLLSLHRLCEAAELVGALMCTS